MGWIRQILRRLLRWSGDTSLDVDVYWCGYCEHCAMEELRNGGPFGGHE